MKRTLGLGLLGLMAVLWSGTVHAGGTPAQKCAAAKLKAVSKKLSAKLKCIQTSITTGVPVDPACLTKAETKFNTAITKAESKGGCTLMGDGATLEQLVDKNAAGIRSFTDPNSLTCCNYGAGACNYALDPNSCTVVFGTPGAAGTVCDAATGNCVVPPANHGNCCLAGTALGTTNCLSGPVWSFSACSGASGWEADPNSLCPPDGGNCIHF